MPISQTPAYNLKAVLQETGITADTLRAWERRYGLPMPERTPGRQRLYSLYDIETVKWLMARQGEGLSISRAVEMWREQIGAGLDPLAGSGAVRLARRALAPAETSLDAVRRHWLEACLAFDEAAAEAALNQAFAILPLEAVCGQVLQRGLSEIGTRWYEHGASVQQEHFASALAMRRLDALISAAAAPTRAETVLIGCPPGEWHTFTPLLLTLFLRRRGFNVIYLGANVPESRFEETIAAVGADLTVLVAQQLVTAASLEHIARQLTAQGAQVGFGGRIYSLQPTLIHRTDGHYLGGTLEASLEEIQARLMRPGKSSPAEEPSPEYVRALALFQSHRPQIELHLSRSTRGARPGAAVAEIPTEFLGNDIAAALQLGDLSLVDAEIDWVRSLLKFHEVPEGDLTLYLQQYAEAVSQNIDGGGKPLTDWLKRYRKEGNA